MSLYLGNMALLVILSFPSDVLNFAHIAASPSESGLFPVIFPQMQWDFTVLSVIMFSSPTPQSKVVFLFCFFL